MLSAPSFAQEDKDEKPYEVLKVDLDRFFDPLRKGIVNGVTESASPMEHSFLSYVLSPANGNYEDGPDTFCRWLIGKKELEDNQVHRLLVFVIILSGTSEGMDLRPFQIDLPSDRSRRHPVRVLLRIPGSTSKPTAKIIAAVEVSTPTQHERYVVSKEFFNQMNQWTPGPAQTEVIRP
jgi:hypothetical protein